MLPMDSIGSTLYIWMDQDGTTHISDRYPQKYAKNLEIIRSSKSKKKKKLVVTNVYIYMWTDEENIFHISNRYPRKHAEDLEIIRSSGSRYVEDQIKTASRKTRTTQKISKEIVSEDTINDAINRIETTKISHKMSSKEVEYLLTHTLQKDYALIKNNKDIDAKQKEELLRKCAILQRIAARALLFGPGTSPQSNNDVNTRTQDIPGLLKKAKDLFKK